MGIGIGYQTLRYLVLFNVLQAEGEAQAITIIDQQLRNNPTYLEWLKTTRWDGILPLVTGGAGGQGVTPFIEIPTSRSEVEEEVVQTSLGNNTTSSSNLPSSALNHLNSATSQQ